jgi:hypothetical protein
MISLTTALWVIFALVIVAVIFAIFWGVTLYTEKEWPVTSPVMKVIRFIIVILFAFVSIGILASLMTGTPLFRP